MEKGIKNMNESVIFTETQTLKKIKKQKVLSIFVVIFSLFVCALNIPTGLILSVNPGTGVSLFFVGFSYLLISFLVTLVGKRSGNYYPLLTVDIMGIVSLIVSVIVFVITCFSDPVVIIAIGFVIMMVIFGVVAFILSLMKIRICKTIEAYSTPEMKEKFISM